jgi:hypothetical protein
MTETEAPALEVNGPQLREALAAIKRLGKRSVSSEALVDFADSEARHDHLRQCYRHLAGTGPCFRGRAARARHHAR